MRTGDAGASVLGLRRPGPVGFEAKIKGLMVICLSLRGRQHHRIIAAVTTDTHCKPLAVFDSPAAVADWSAVNDNVMGGRSSGGARYLDGALIFSGKTNTDGGGFSSIRAALQPGELAAANGLKLRVRSDGRLYQVTLRTDLRYRGMPVAFRAEIDAPEEGKWTDSVVSFDTLVPTVFGRPVSGASFEAEKATTIGFIINDGKDGAFELAIRSIHACTF
jgi:hypothetical protein